MRNLRRYQPLLDGGSRSVQLSPRENPSVVRSYQNHSTLSQPTKFKHVNQGFIGGSKRTEKSKLEGSLQVGTSKLSHLQPANNVDSKEYFASLNNNQASSPTNHVGV